LAMPKRVMMIIKLKPWKVILTNYKIVTWLNQIALNYL
jgi:hypothetical protein